MAHGGIQPMYDREWGVRRRDLLIPAFALFFLVNCKTGYAESIKRKLPSPATSVKVGRLNLDSAAQFELSPLEARTVATRAAESLVQIASHHVTSKKQRLAMEDALARSRQDLDDLTAERDLALSQMRQGFYCSKCKRSKIEIEKTGVSFAAHLVEVQGRPVPAPAELVREKEAYYAKRLGELIAELKLKRSNLQKLNGYIDVLSEQFKEGVALWRTAIDTQFLIIDSNSNAKRRMIDRELAKMDKQLTEINELEANIDKDSDLKSEERTYRKKATKFAREQLRQEKRDLQAALVSNAAAHSEEISTATVNRDADFARIREAAAFVFEDAWQPVALPKMRATIGSITVESAPTRLGVSFAFNAVVQMGYEATFDPAANSHEAKAFVSIFERARVFASYTNKSSFDGTKEGYGGGAEITKPDPDGLYTPEIKIDKVILDGKRILPKP